MRDSFPYFPVETHGHVHLDNLVRIIKTIVSYIVTIIYHGKKIYYNMAKPYLLVRFLHFYTSRVVRNKLVIILYSLHRTFLREKN